jgi:hypothetical protein
LQTHLANCLKMNRLLARGVEADMPLGEFARRSDEQIHAGGLTNNVSSITDPTGVNIGHTIPAVTQGWNAAERAVFDQGDWTAAAELISHRRGWVNAVETMTAGEAVAFTVEPRLSVPARPGLPMATFHTIVIVEGGRKQFLAGFDELFELVGMDYMPTIA